jgi:c-di-GMP-related signal transduction protein
LGGDDAFRADRDAMFGRLEIQIHQNALVYLGLGEQNFPFVQLLAAFFDRLTTGMVLRLLTRAVLCCDAGA